MRQGEEKRCGETHKSLGRGIVLELFQQAELETEIYWIDVIKNELTEGAGGDIPPLLLLLEIRDESVSRSEKCLNPKLDM